VTWVVERVAHFGPGDLIHDDLVHFGFHDRDGRHYAVEHQHHFLGRIGTGDRLDWTVAGRPVIDGVPNVTAELEFPMYVDALRDGSLIVSNFGNARLYRIDVERLTAELLVDGRALGMADMGNCVVDDDGDIWVNEVTGCRIWQLDPGGAVVRILGNGEPGFQRDPIGFDEARFSWIYDIRPGPDGRIYVLDSRNYALRAIDRDERLVHTLAGDGTPGDDGDGGDARGARFGGERAAKFDGPISLSVDEAANLYVGDRYNHVVRMIEHQTGTIRTIAGRRAAEAGRANDPTVRDPLALNLPEISSMDYFAGRLFVPTDLTAEAGDLAVLRRDGPLVPGAYHPG
jgi:hypothetical protein